MTPIFSDCSPTLSQVKTASKMSMLWFKFILGLMFFELVLILFAIVLDYGNE